MKRFFLSTFLFLIFGAPVYSTFAAEKSNRDFDHSHGAWTLFLKKHITVNGHASTVDYKSVKKDPDELLKYLETLEAVSKKEFDRFSENEKLAFLINAYNALTIELIIDHYPVKSIKDIGSLFSSPWKKEFFRLFGEKRHLDNIEHDMIRKWFNEPRIHFALVCAAKGCPALRNEAYVAAKLNEQLEDAASNFLADQSRNRYLPEKNKLEISSIFKWYGEDFVKKFGSIESYLAERMTGEPSQQNLIRKKKASVSYLDYDWSLNDKD